MGVDDFDAKPVQAKRRGRRTVGGSGPIRSQDRYAFAVRLYDGHLVWFDSFIGRVAATQG